MNAEGAAVIIPSGALSEDTIVDLFRLDEGELPLIVPTDMNLLAAINLDMGEDLSQSALLSIARPSGVADDAQVVVAQVISDPLGVRRMKVVGLGQVQPVGFAFLLTNPSWGWLIPDDRDRGNTRRQPKPQPWTERYRI